MATESSREERNRKLFQTAQVLVLCFGVFLILMGGIASSSEKDLAQLLGSERFASPTLTHHYAVSTHNILVGLLFIICSIGLYVPLGWARRLTLFTCIWYLVDTVVLTVWEYEARVSVNLFQAFGDVVFWLVLPIIVVVLLLVTGSGTERPRKEAPTAGAPEEKLGA